MPDTVYFSEVHRITYEFKAFVRVLLLGDCLSGANALSFCLFIFNPPKVIQSSDIPLLRPLMIGMYREYHLLPAQGISAETS